MSRQKKWTTRFPELHLVDSFPRSYDLPRSAEKSIRVRVVQATLKGRGNTVQVIRGDVRSFNGHTQHSEAGPGLMVDATEAERMGLTDLAKAITAYEKKSKLLLDITIARKEPKTPLQVAMDRIVRFMRTLPAEARREGVPVTMIEAGVHMNKQMRWRALNGLLKRRRMVKSKHGVKLKPKLWRLVEQEEAI